MTVDELIVESLKRVAHLNKEENGLLEANLDNLQTRLIYPKYREGRGTIRRISEQELKQVFIEVLNESKERHNFFHSFETPTFNTYCFEGESPSSGNIDVCLYEVFEDNSVKLFKRKYLLEFKANNREEFASDFEKLANEIAVEETNKPIETFFVHIVDGFDGGTKASLEEKYTYAFRKFRNSQNKLTIYLLTPRYYVNKRPQDAVPGYYKIELKIDDVNRSKNNLDIKLTNFIPI